MCGCDPFHCYTKLTGHLQKTGHQSARGGSHCAQSSSSICSQQSFITMLSGPEAAIFTKANIESCSSETWRHLDELTIVAAAGFPFALLDECSSQNTTLKYVQESANKVQDHPTLLCDMLNSLWNTHRHWLRPDVQSSATEKPAASGVAPHNKPTSEKRGVPWRQVNKAAYITLRTDWLICGV